MKVVVAGDFYPENRVARLIEQKEYQTIFPGLSSILQSADYCMVNLEAPIVLGNYAPIAKLGLHLACHQNSADCLRSIGFHMVTLANNHIMDYGLQGLSDTLAVCKEYQLDTVGVGDNLADAGKIFYKSVEDKTLAIINCCEHEFSIATDSCSGANPLNPIAQYRQITKACTKADYILVVVHGGHEHFPLPSPRMVETYRFFIDAGADAVVNHHQHCYSGYEYYNGKPIFYGIGNFCFDEAVPHFPLWNDGYIVELNFEDNKVSFEIHPYRQCAEKPEVTLLGKDSFQKNIERLNSIIADEGRLREEVNNYYAQSCNQMRLALEPYQDRYMKALSYRRWLPSFITKKKKIQLCNYIDCESHRDRMLYFLHSKRK